jgi:hypothetical protein
MASATGARRSKTPSGPRDFGTGIQPAPIGIVQSGISAGRTSGIEAVLVNTAGGVTSGDALKPDIAAKAKRGGSYDERLNAPTAPAYGNCHTTVLNCGNARLDYLQRNDPVRQLCIVHTLWTRSRLFSNQSCSGARRWGNWGKCHFKTGSKSSAMVAHYS